MAEEQQAEIEDTGSGKKKLKMMLLILVGVLVVAGASIGGTLFLLSPGADDPAAEGDAAMSEQDMEASIAAGPANYLAMQPAFVVNFNEAGRTRFLQLELSLVSRDVEAIDMANMHMPLLRNNLLQTLAEQDFETLKTVEGKQQLVESLTATVQATIEEKLGRPGFETVLFRSFVMQ
ncbi:flagellar basal body-associated FliL family protein [Saccharospirillum impatiens]|uniref:flagellar basal body-associated FliL family protein n=1 Tax=Saccharospirillum impatiens TaxID=169438 RepID=UPI00041F4593|nr:flagellar basal body-associated FliL family protein [Saccharospirillum impatiens]